MFVYHFVTLCFHERDESLGCACAALFQANKRLPFRELPELVAGLTADPCSRPLHESPMEIRDGMRISQCSW